MGHLFLGADICGNGVQITPRATSRHGPGLRVQAGPCPYGIYGNSKVEEHLANGQSVPAVQPRAGIGQRQRVSPRYGSYGGSLGPPLFGANNQNHGLWAFGRWRCE